MKTTKPRINEDQAAAEYKRARLEFEQATARPITGTLFEMKVAFDKSRVAYNAVIKAANTLTRMHVAIPSEY